MPLPARGADLQNIGPARVAGPFDGLMAFFARSLLQMRPVSEVIKAESSPKPCIVLHRVRLLCVTGIACGELLTRLMDVTRITLRMSRHAGLQARLVKSMTEVAFR